MTLEDMLDEIKLTLGHKGFAQLAGALPIVVKALHDELARLKQYGSQANPLLGALSTIPLHS